MIFPLQVPVIIVGGGAAGLIASLAVREQGIDALIIERDAKPAGNTSLSSGMIPAANTRFQIAKGVVDTPQLMVADILKKNGGRSDAAVVAAIAAQSGPTVEWLADLHGVEFELVEGFLYPGHSQPRMHAPPNRTGVQLMTSLLRAARAQGIDIVTSGRVHKLFATTNGHVKGVQILRPDGEIEDVGCDALILACNGFGANNSLVKRFIPEMADATYFGHAGNQGDAILWADELGAALSNMSAYQGHGSVAVPESVLITWALIMEGGIQVNVNGDRFSNEHLGYSEQAGKVLNQPGRIVWNIYDERIHELGRSFADYRDAQSAGAVKRAVSVSEMAHSIGVPESKLSGTLNACAEMASGQISDTFGRDFSLKPVLSPPYYFIRVTGALFHTQGGLAIDPNGRVKRPDDNLLPNLLAAGGAACGLSGTDAAGYLSGNGLLSAAVLGRICGYEASRLVQRY